MNNTLRKIETDEVVIYKSHTYNTDTLKKCRQLHSELVKSGKLEGKFDSDKWMGYSGIKHFGMDFSIDPESYKKHIGKEFGISLETMKNMLRCYAKSNNSGVEQKESNYRELFDKRKKCSERTCNKQFDIYAEQGIPI